jgi:hypothetical protein
MNEKKKKELSTIGLRWPAGSDASARGVDGAEGVSALRSARKCPSSHIRAQFSRTDVHVKMKERT